MTASKQETRDSQSIADRRQSKSGSRRVKNPIVQSTQGETMQAATQEVQSVDNQQSVNTEAQTMTETQTHSIDSTVQATQEPAKQMTAFEAMLKARLEFEEKKTAAILQVRQLCDDWQINIKRDVYPESIKARKPYTKRKVKEEVGTAAAAPTGAQTPAGQATPLSDAVKAAEPAHV